ncbi:MAG: hypothetical protein M1819_003285 [Sarea resinae]|nr:MAG: hypothetical protein M1819_003285 [Sarea resinae]
MYVRRSITNHPRPHFTNRRITISITTPPDAPPPDQDILSLDLSPELTAADLKAIVQNDTNYPPESQHFYHNGQPLTDDTKTLEELRINDGDMLGMQVQSPAAASGRGAAANTRRSAGPSRGAAAQGRSTAGGRQGPDPEMVRLQILGDPQMRAEVAQRSPELSRAVEDPARFREIWYGLQQDANDAERNRQREIMLLNEDPFNIEAQAKIEEMIRQEAVMENLQNALDYTPEAFGKVHMLYIDVEVNGHKVKAFVDSGAQATIMSPSCAEKCGIMRLVDKRFAGIARGVGTAQILGRVHSAQIKIDRLFLACSFTVMEGKDVDLLLGLDMLKRHQACIDLRSNRLVIQDVQVPFLGEADIPKYADELANEPMVEGPAGMKVGARSGALTQPQSQQGQASAQAGASSTSSSSAAAAADSANNFQGRGQTLGAGADQQQQTPSIPARQTAPQAAAPAAASSQYSPEMIAQLEQLGFSRQEAVAALDATDGDIELAASMMFR